MFSTLTAFLLQSIQKQIQCRLDSAADIPIAMEHKHGGKERLRRTPAKVMLITQKAKQHFSTWSFHCRHIISEAKP